MASSASKIFIRASATNMFHSPIAIYELTEMQLDEVILQGFLH